MLRTFTLLGAANAFLAVALGAFGAHALRSRLSPDMLAIYQTATHYHLAHALGLLLIALLADRLPAAGLVNASGWLIFAGIVLFCGSLYALALSGIRPLGAITPFGGLAFLAGWLILLIAAAKGAS